VRIETNSVFGDADNPGPVGEHRRRLPAICSVDRRLNDTARLYDFAGKGIVDGQVAAGRPGSRNLLKTLGAKQQNSSTGCWIGTPTARVPRILRLM